VYVERLLALIQPKRLVAVGRVAEEILGSRATYVRHPANGGATAFAEGMRALLGA
jgi:uracil-DNA glycosylase